MLASAVVVGLVAGLATGGRFSRLGELYVRWWPVLAVAIVLRSVAGLTGDLAAATYVVAFAGIVAVALANRGLAGAWLIALGAALNLLVVAVNGAMPISAAVVAGVGGAMPTDRLHTALTSASRLVPLSDVIPFPVVRTAYSVGDVLIAAGGGWLTFAALRGK
ncbi:MAG: DUF5317 family protein [Chloroflexota bacterium]|nr:DUF5317 family protein [Chloroflexota bacterium]MDE3192498.1 DUF5317 family protein [Chloroflexota bacterium]